jgi:hypothetical protein
LANAYSFDDGLSDYNGGGSQVSLTMDNINDKTLLEGQGASEGSCKNNIAKTKFKSIGK